jgi:hypothetical protein
VIDDYCPRCRLLLNHDVTSLFGDAVAKVTCRKARQQVAHGPGARVDAEAA